MYIKININIFLVDTPFKMYENNFFYSKQTSERRIKCYISKKKIEIKYCSKEQYEYSTANIVLQQILILIRCSNNNYSRVGL